MRIGQNPHKDVPKQLRSFSHQIVIPVYIPSFDGYFEDSFEIFKLCLQSIFRTVHSQTFITIVNNGSCDEVLQYLNGLYSNGQIHEIIHAGNIGKLNAILKGIAGIDLPIVTIADADAMFLPGWQKATADVFNRMPKTGVVGLVPQIKMGDYFCGNVIFDNLFSGKLKFLKLHDPEALRHFYKSIGWTMDFNQDHAKYALGLEKDGFQALLGCGHFVATYKRDVFGKIPSWMEFKLGGDSEKYLDMVPLEKDYWRLTTAGNFAYHMGNKLEPWMHEVLDKMPDTNKDGDHIHVIGQRKINQFKYFVKNRLLPKILKQPAVYRYFCRSKGLPADAAKNYHKL